MQQDSDLEALQVLQYKTDRSSDLKKIEKLNNRFFQLMACGEAADAGVLDCFIASSYAKLSHKAEHISLHVAAPLETEPKTEPSAQPTSRPAGPTHMRQPKKRRAKG